MSLTRSRSLGWAALSLLGIAGCATGPAPRPLPSDHPKELLQTVCAVGRDTHSVKGSFILKVHTPRANGQFPATAEATDPDRLTLEITNLLGGTEAIVRVEGKKYEIQLPSKKNQAPEKGEGLWNGLPLRWAPELFLGRIPCPGRDRLGDSQVTVVNGQLVVEMPHTLATDPERFVYSDFAGKDGALLPQSIHWERKGSVPISVEFKMDGNTKWEVHSAQGEVKVRWKDRTPN